MKTYILILLTFFILPQSGELEKLQNTFNALNGFSVQFAQYQGDKKGMSGKVFYAKGNKLRMELRDVLIISDGESVWSYNKKQKKITITALTGTELSILNLPELINEYPKNAVVEESSVKGETVITLTPKAKSASYKKAVVTVNDGGYIGKLNITARDGNQTELRFSSYDTGKSLSPGLFVMDSPEGVEVIDLR